jgi:hypothetical protein
MKFGNHFHTESIDITEEGEGVLWHAVEQSLPPDEDGGFHQGAGGIAQKDPIDGEVDGGFEAGAIEVDIIEVNIFCEAEIERVGGRLIGLQAGDWMEWGAGEQPDKSGVDRSQSGFVDDMSEAVAGAFGEGFDPIKVANQEEPLEQEAIGEADAELAVVEAFEVPGNIAAQGEDAVTGELRIALGTGFFGIEFLMCSAEVDEVVFQTGGGEEFVDADQKLAFFAVFLAAIDIR